MGNGLESFQKNKLLLKVYLCTSCLFHLHHHIADLASGLAAGRLRPAVEPLSPGQVFLLHRGALALSVRPVGTEEHTQEVNRLHFLSKPI